MIKMFLGKLQPRVKDLKDVTALFVSFDYYSCCRNVNKICPDPVEHVLTSFKITANFSHSRFIMRELSYLYRFAGFLVQAISFRLSFCQY